MTNETFVIGLGLALAPMLYWRVRSLPGERWQILAAVPQRKMGRGVWTGVNLTFYGFLAATAYALALSVFLLLMGSIAIPLAGVASLMVPMLMILALAATLLSRIVERKRYTFTVCGVALTGILVLPLAVAIANRILAGWGVPPVPVLPALAAFLTSYCLGEGMGRLACISFGCCYGKPLDQLGPAARRFFEHFHFAFTGEMKKIAYSSGLDGAKVVPVQALSALVLVLSGLVGVSLFLNSRYGAAVLVTALVSQLWRVYSEGLRADYRGDHRVSAYRVLSLAAAGCAAGRLMVLPGAPQIRYQLNLGLALLWDPKVLLALQALWLFVFFWLGRSMVTQSTLVMSVRKHRV